ncbi:Uncharacterised protein [Vibrio cholerae]|nr:Uncharacterised protein [Vibrio cholerae]CSI34347.1 Uncharacterised protein [Vibrio cholerae]
MLFCNQNILFTLFLIRETQLEITPAFAVERDITKTIRITAKTQRRQMSIRAKEKIALSIKLE